jgi:anti-anti-sigma factor
MNGIQEPGTTRPQKPDGSPAGRQVVQTAGGQSGRTVPVRYEEDHMASTAQTWPSDGASLVGTIEVAREAEAITALDLYGEFDLSSSPQIVEHAQRAIDDDNHLIINLSEATFIDSSVIHALFRAASAAKGRGNACVLQLGTAAIVKRVMTLTCTDKQIATARTRAEAINLIHQHITRNQ